MFNAKCYGVLISSSAIFTEDEDCLFQFFKMDIATCEERCRHPADQAVLEVCDFSMTRRTADYRAVERADGHQNLLDFNFAVLSETDELRCIDANAPRRTAGIPSKQNQVGVHRKMIRIGILMG